MKLIQNLCIIRESIIVLIIPNTILEIDWIMSSFQHWDHGMIHEIFNVNVLNFVSFSADYALPECLSWFFARLRALYTALPSKSMSLWWQIFTNEIK